LLYNPNNVTDEAAPVTVQQEIQVGHMVSEMLGFGSRRSWAHLCSGGTIANTEALWVARQVQFMPFVLRDYCTSFNVPFEIKTANRVSARLVDLPDSALLALRPNESIFMSRKLARFEIDELGRDHNVTLKRINNHIQKSEYNIRKRGSLAVHEKLNKTPVVFVSAAAHYCIKKITSLLGYGEDAVRLISVDSKFRVNMAELTEHVWNLPENHYIAMVIGIVGTTEEGAVDPIHTIAKMRDELAEKCNRSFWLHLDAAWGGYVRSIFKGFPETEDKNNNMNLQGLYDFFRTRINAREEAFRLSNNERFVISWDNPDVYRAMIAMRDADSITVDPHKMGYVPYPAGIIAFRNGLVTELMTQKAQYISSASEGLFHIDEIPEISAVGPYILEGSKPGFVATGCWLAHSCIPLTNKGHGKIIKTSMLNSKKLAKYLAQHAKDFAAYEKRLAATGKDNATLLQAFTFVPICDPDLNVVCFVTIPMMMSGGQLKRLDTTLEKINALNEEIHLRLDIPNAARGKLTPHKREFFVSKTRFDRSQYSSSSLSELLNKVGVSKLDYAKHGLTVLRSTVMNPLLYTALDEPGGVDYIRMFVEYLHLTARSVLNP
jgi:glutamate/tyrosine decarboxylase-like PLP-dependent enzyme